MASDPSIGRPPTIRTVAARAGVSKSLVSLVLQNSPRVSNEKRQAVLRAVAELGYRPDPVARSLAERRTRTIGVILDDLSSPWWTDILDGLRLVLHKRVCVRCWRTAAPSPMPWRPCPTCGLTALCWSARRRSPPLRNGVPWAVRCRRSSPVRVTRLFPRVDLVAHDDYRGGRLATTHLLELGHRRSRTSSEWARGAGSVGRVTKRLSPTSVCALFPAQGDWTEATGSGSRRELLASSDRPTAILAANDLSAVGVLNAADELGLAVPGDVSVVGYDNTAYSRLPRLSITTIDGHNAEVGQLAGRTLVARIGGDASSVETRLLSPTLIRRSSTGPPPTL